MASLTQRVSDLALDMATQIKSVRTVIGNLQNLTTTQRGDIVTAINEVKSGLATAGAQINDAQTSNSKVWSSSNTAQKIQDAAASVKADILGGASAAYDTLQELAQLIQNEQVDIGSIMTALGNRLRIDVNNQGLTAAQQLNGQTNLNVYSKTDIGTPDTDFVAIFESGLQ